MNEKFDMSQLKPLCRGNRTDRGWSQDEAGNWTPSLHDRRRLAIGRVAPTVEASGHYNPFMLLTALKENSSDEKDFQALVENFHDWQQATH